MISYRPNAPGLIGRSIAALSFLVLFGWLMWIWPSGGGPWVLLPILLLVPIAYSYPVPLVCWPVSVSFNSVEQKLVLKYLLLPSRVVPRDQVMGCVVSKVRARELYEAYILILHYGNSLVLSDLNIAPFPGRFAHEMRLTEMKQLPTFIPGFRRLMHRQK